MKNEEVLEFGSSKSVETKNEIEDEQSKSSLLTGSEYSGLLLNTAKLEVTQSDCDESVEEEKEL